MKQLLGKGMKLNGATSGIEYVVDDLLGAGGQGEVYRVCDGQSEFALKWYSPDFSAENATPRQKAALEQVVARGTPGPQFLWPIEMVGLAVRPCDFGYVMPLRQKQYAGIVDLLRRRVHPTFRVLASAGRELAHGFMQLHSKGLCYGDISFGNVFFNPNGGAIAICDNDNVVVDGEEGPVGGTPGFMAPEIMRFETGPSTQTDLHSLAVLLFYMFHFHHPLHGKNEMAIHSFDDSARKRLYGDDPVFIFDPVNDANRPVPGEQDNPIIFWGIYPNFFRDAFVRAFIDGLAKKPKPVRVRENEWRDVLARLGDSIIPCAHCHSENFYEPALGQAKPCWSCGNPVVLPPRIRIKNQVVMLNAGTQLFPHHIDDRRLYDYETPVAEVVQNPVNPQQWGLKNLSAEKWVATLSNGALRDIEPGRSVALGEGAKINFGRETGEIRA